MRTNQTKKGDRDRDRDRDGDKEELPSPLVSPLRLDAANAQAWQGEQLLKLTPKAFTVLQYLLANAGRLVTKEELMRSVWADTVVTDGALVACIRELRKTLQDDTQQPHYIETVHRRGYRFIAPLFTALAPSQKWKVKSQKSSSIPRTQHLMSMLVGRETELSQLYQYWERALRGERQLVFVTGEPGIGKTSMIQAFLRQLGTKGWGLEPNASFFQAPRLKPPVSGVWVGRGQCIEQYGAGEAYLPVLEALGRLCRGPEGGRLMGLLQQHAPTWLVQMPALLSATEYESLQRKTQGATRDRMLRELAEALEAITAERPLLLVLEDLHWSDPSTLDFLSMLVRRSEVARLLVIGSYRPVDVIVREHPLKAIKTELQLHQHCQELPLEPLSEAQVGEYLRARFAVPAPLEEESCPEPGRRRQGEGDVPVFWHKLARLIHHRTEGNPLFAVAMVDDLVARGLILPTDAGWELREATATEENWIPDTIRQLVTLQSGRVTPEAQQVLEAASVAGVVFSAAAVAAALMTETVEIEWQCEHLVARQYFLRRVGREAWPDGTLAARYRFSHAVYQQLWHERVSPTQLQQYHLRIGERKERGYGERSGEIAVELAVHFEQGCNYDKAVQYFHQAGRSALQYAAYQEAISHLSKGLELLKTQTDIPGPIQQELLLLITLAPALVAAEGFTAPEVKHVYDQIRTLSRRLEATPQLLPILVGLGCFSLVRVVFQVADELGERLLTLIQSVQSSALYPEVYQALGQTLCSLVDLVSA